ncbi:hypothetical protein I3271_05725 [Photobacterium leiognathi]|uniref:hypothetical protein n=1 Tax=Photobacterium leiognathi TaxID=553611 RepID=UPI001EDFC5E1|nr:hypothetical protein [Photobacterium leiognathi]MCG3884181.1 hypothetical protein [Photobacterium leiognathi]
MTQIINSKDDMAQSGFTREQIIAMATTTIRYDDAVYPKGYDQNLKEGDEGYIAPIYRYEDEIQYNILERFGIEL